MLRALAFLGSGAIVAMVLHGLGLTGGHLIASALFVGVIASEAAVAVAEQR